MGRWTEVVRIQPPKLERHHDDRYRELIVGQIAPHPLMSAFDTLCRSSPGHRLLIEKEFPLLERIRAYSPAYVDEDLWLTSAEAGQLVEELLRMRRICRREEFISGLDGRVAYENWRDGQMEAFETWVDKINELLAAAAGSGYWVRMQM